MMKKTLIALGITLLANTSVHAIDAEYRKRLERSGCTQASELQGCDINKTRAQNAKAGFVADTPVKNGSATKLTPYAGQWVAKGPTGATVATIRIDGKERVWVNGKPVKARRSDGALVFRDGSMTYTIQGDRRLKDEDTWSDSDAGTHGPVLVE